MLEVPYRKTTNEYLKERGSTKSIVSINGRLYIDCVVQSVVRGSLFTTREIGEASGNMKSFDFHYGNAINNAIYKHISKGGVSGARVIEVKDYWIKYFNDEVSVKRKLVKKPDKIIQVPPSSRIISRKKREIKEVKVKSYIRNGVIVKPHIRKLVKEYTIYDEVLVKGYSYKVSGGKGSYKNVVKFKDEVLLKEDYKRKSIKNLNKDLYDINKHKNRVSRVDDL